MSVLVRTPLNHAALLVRESHVRCLAPDVTRMAVHKLPAMLDDRVRAVLARLEEEDADERARGVERSLRARAVAPTTGRFLFALVAPQTACEVLEVGGSRGYSTIWLAAGARILGGRVVSIENDPAKCEAWRQNVEEAGLSEWAELVEGDASEQLSAIDDIFDVVFIDAEKEDYEGHFRLARPKVEPGGLIVADNVLSHEETLGAYSRARQSDPELVSVTVPLDRGLEVSVVLTQSLE
jgi:predicted O-methyltransferase YrrM